MNIQRPPISTIERKDVEGIFVAWEKLLESLPHSFLDNDWAKGLSDVVFALKFSSSLREILEDKPDHIAEFRTNGEVLVRKINVDIWDYNYKSWTAGYEAICKMYEKIKLPELPK